MICTVPVRYQSDKSVFCDFDATYKLVEHVLKVHNLPGVASVDGAEIRIIGKIIPCDSEIYVPDVHNALDLPYGVVGHHSVRRLCGAAFLPFLLVLRKHLFV